MIYDWFLKELSDEEIGLLLIVMRESYEYDVAYADLRLLRRDVVVNMLERIKPRILEESRHMIENLQKKLITLTTTLPAATAAPVLTAAAV